MAFSTELVLRGGPLAEYITTAYTTPGTGWSTSITLPAGEWMVVVRCRGSILTGYGGSETISIDGATRFRWYPGDGNADCVNPTAVRQVTGGRSVTVGATGSYFTGSRGWDIYAARIG